MQISYNIELNATEEEKAQVVSFLTSCKSIYNSMSKDVYVNKPVLGIKEIHDLCYYKHRNLFPNFPAQAFIKCEQEVKSNYRSVKSNKHKITEPIEKQTLALRLDKNICSKFTQTSIRINVGTDKRVEFKLKLFDKVKDLFSKYKPLDPLLFYREGRVFLSISFDVPEILPKDESLLGVDLGMRRLFATSDGQILKADEFCKYKRRIRYQKRMLQQKNTISSKRKLKKLRRKETNFSRNYIHNAVNTLLKTDKSVIILEDLTKIKAKKNKFQNTNRKSQVPFYMFRTIISYKAPIVGKLVATVNPSYTSQNDSRKLSRGKRLGCRYYAVDGKVLDADVNAACNIAQKHSKHPVSFRFPVDGNCDLIGRLLINQPANSGDKVSTNSYL